jgi:hypothetical protein
VPYYPGYWAPGWPYRYNPPPYVPPVVRPPIPPPWNRGPIPPEVIRRSDFYTISSGPSFVTTRTTTGTVVRTTISSNVVVSTNPVTRTITPLPGQTKSVIEVNKTIPKIKADVLELQGKGSSITKTPDGQSQVNIGSVVNGKFVENSDKDLLKTAAPEIQGNKNVQTVVAQTATAAANSSIDNVTQGTGYKNETGLTGTNTSSQNPNEAQSRDTGSATDASTRNDTAKLPSIDVAIRYPEDLNSTQDYILFTSDGKSVALPIQASITDQNSVQWGGDSLNEIEKMAYEASRGLMNINSESNLNQFTEKFGSEIQTLLGSVNKDDIQRYLAGQAIGNQNVLSRFGGKIINPNLELLFQGPQLRPFNFQFKLSPRSDDEGKMVKKIISFFKKNMAVKQGSSKLFLQKPNTFNIKYKGKGANGLNMIKEECALLSCAVDYTPMGTYMTFQDGTMVSYTLTLSFQETKPVYYEDYKNPEEIGF